MDALQVTQTIMDEYSARILLGTFDRPASAIELGRRFGIPIAACYRRIKELEGLGLVYGERAFPEWERAAALSISPQVRPYHVRGWKASSPRRARLDRRRRGTRERGHRAGHEPPRTVFDGV